jgi:hypothetical protein
MSRMQFTGILGVLQSRRLRPRLLVNGRDNGVTYNWRRPLAPRDLGTRGFPFRGGGILA